MLSPRRLNTLKKESLVDPYKAAATMPHACLLRDGFKDFRTLFKRDIFSVSLLLLYICV